MPICLAQAESSRSLTSRWQKVLSICEVLYRSSDRIRAVDDHAFSRCGLENV